MEPQGYRAIAVTRRLFYCGGMEVLDCSAEGNLAASKT
jgi:hypothetical protein